MDKWTRQMSVALIFVVVGLIAWRVMRTRGPISEPVYRGKSLSTWLRDFDYGIGSPRGAAARVAVRQLGTNSLHTLATRSGANVSFQTNRLKAPGSAVERLTGCW